MNVDFVRDALREDATLARPPDPNLYESVLALRHRSDRRRRASLAAGLAVLVVSVAVPVGLSLLGAPDPQVISPPSVPTVNVFTAAPRGSLAADAGFVEAVRQLSWAMPGVASDPGIPDAPVESRHVVFAGDVASGRWALVVGANTTRPTGEAADPDLQTDLGALSDIAGLWFVGPAGAAPEQMRPATVPRGIPTDLPTSLYDATTGALVVVAAPEDFVEVSLRPDVAADASVTRTYTDTATGDGVAVLALDPNPFGSFGPPAVQYRVSRGGVVVADQPPDGYAPPEGITPPPLNLEYLRPPDPADPGSANLAEDMGAAIVGEYGLASDQFEFLVHYSGAVPGSGGLPAGLTVLTATFPSGAVLIRAEWRQQIAPPQAPNSVASATGGWCANELSPAGVPPNQRALAIRCDLASGRVDANTESSLVVLVPQTIAASSLTALAGDGKTTVLVLDDVSASGVVMVPFPEGAETVRIQLSDGAVFDEVPIRTS